MNLFDGLGAAYMAYGAWSGRRRGLPLELYRFVRTTVAFAAGCGVYSLLGGVLRAVAGTLVPVPRLIGFGLGLGGAYYLLRLARLRTVAWLEPRLRPEWRGWGGAALGAVRRLVIMLGIAVALHLTPSKGVHEQTTTGSVLGRLAAVFAADEAAGAAGEK